MSAQSKSRMFVVVGALRAMGLLKLADHCKYLLGLAAAWASNRRFHARYPGFVTPPQHLVFDATNKVEWERYRGTGLRQATLFARLMREELPKEGPVAVLEWGCGPGRLIRHMGELMAGARTVSLTGTDYNRESIAWCRANLPGITFADNDLAPPLPFPEASFDAIYAFSVVTHLSEANQLDWLKELRRVLKPGGVLVFTTQGANYLHLLAAQEEKDAYAAGRVVVQGRYEEGKKWFLAIQPEAFVRDRLLEGWAGVRRAQTFPEDDILQDVWVARKPGRPQAASD